MPYDVGGLTGGIYELFEIVGGLFFSVLIGPTRGGRRSLETSRVVVGGIILCGVVIAIIALLLGISTELFPPAPPLGYLAAGAGIGAFGGLVIALIVVGYVGAVEADIQREQALKAAEQKRLNNEKRIEELKKKKYREYVSQGVSERDAREKAETEARREVSGGCFIASAAFESPEAPQVNFLRLWRDDVLLPRWYGRVFVSVYYAVSPGLAAVIRNSVFLRRVTRSVLESFCNTVSTR
jgi:hypothetical protein